MDVTSSSRSSPTSSERLAVGLVVGVKGLKGGLKVEPLSDREDRLDAGAAVYLDGEPTARRITGAEAPRRVRVVTLEGVETREDAEALVGRYLEVDAEPLPEGLYYWHEVLGITVFDQSGRELGAVEEVFRAGENEVYRVVGVNGEVLIPALRQVVLALDIGQRRMSVRLDEEEVR